MAWTITLTYIRKQSGQNSQRSLLHCNFQARRLRDFYEGSAVVCEMDSQYRIVIPQKLREYAGLDREVVMIGHTDTVAIWDKAAWDKINSPEEIDLKEIAEIGELFNI